MKKTFNPRADISSARIIHAARQTRDTVSANLNGRATLYSRWRSEFQITDFRFHIWNLRFAICNPEGHAFVPEGLRLNLTFTVNNPG